MRRRRERTPSPVEEEEEEQRSEEDEEEAKEGAARSEREVWLRGPSQLPRRPIPPARRPMIRPLEPK